MGKKRLSGKVMARGARRAHADAIRGEERSHKIQLLTDATLKKLVDSGVFARAGGDVIIDEAFGEEVIRALRELLEAKFTERACGDFGVGVPKEHGRVLRDRNVLLREYSRSRGRVGTVSAAEVDVGLAVVTALKRKAMESVLNDELSLRAVMAAFVVDSRLLALLSDFEHEISGDDFEMNPFEAGPARRGGCG